MKNSIAFIVGMSIGSVSGAALLADAKPGELIYRTQSAVIQLSAGQAAPLAQAFVSAGVWDGDPATITHCQVFATPPGEGEDPAKASPFSANCHGLKRASADKLPLDSDKSLQVIGVVR